MLLYRSLKALLNYSWFLFSLYYKGNKYHEYYHGGGKMKPLYLVMAIGFFIIGGLISLSQENPSVSQHSIKPVYVNVTLSIPEKTIMPTSMPTQAETVHPASIIVSGRPVLTIDLPASEIDWNSIQGIISKEDIAFWIGRNNSDWNKSNEIIYQRISNYIKERRNRVVVKSAIFRKMIYSQDRIIHMADNVLVGDLSEAQNVKLTAYATLFDDPNYDRKSIKVVFFYDDQGDLVAFGYGDSASVVTKASFVSTSNSEENSSGSSGGSGGGDEEGGPSEPAIQ